MNLLIEIISLLVDLMTTKEFARHLIVYFFLHLNSSKWIYNLTFVVIPVYIAIFQKQYRLSKTRGRALIISNKCGTTRPGSEHDYANLQRMFEDFGFVTVGDHKDYTATVVSCKRLKCPHFFN